METNLKIYTSNITENNIDSAISKNLLPIFIPKTLKGLVEKYTGSAIHFKELSPSNSARDTKGYIIELSSLNFQNIIRKLENLSELSNSDGVVLFDYDENYSESCRYIISELFNKSGILKNTITELP